MKKCKVISKLRELESTPEFKQVTQLVSPLTLGELMEMGNQRGAIAQYLSEKGFEVTSENLEATKLACTRQVGSKANQATEDLKNQN